MDILSTTYSYSDLVMLGFFLLMVGGVAGIAVGLTLLSDKDAKKFSFCSIVLGCVLISLFIVSLNTQEKTIIEHEVLIDSFNDFDYNKYEIVSQRGKIFTIEELPRVSEDDNE